MRNNFLFLACLFFISGCATPMVVSLQKHSGHYIATNNPDKAPIYIYRKSGYIGAMRGIYVDINGKRAGALNSGTYFVYETDPGEVVVSVENWLGKSPYRVVNAEAGKTYYVQGGVKMGLWDADPFIQLVVKEEGETDIQKLVYATMKEKDLK